ncbi:GNAT family N-acetyltransferase [Nocardioides solisilvae]|uniref:GNAT family N-acetyltransferase n=1 Tax=Nocardioides solisilvae TaxID=1542435 RepID=UPI0013A5423B|nr:GNAT family N-acetyltransferase [Nocardioides solisilvae]
MTGAPTTRPWALGDLEQVVALEAALFGAEAWGAEAWTALVDGPGRRASVAVLDGDVVGHALTGGMGDFAELLRLGVRPDHQRRGVASLLLSSALADVRADGAERVLLEVSAVNAPAVVFYARHGFERIDVRPRYYRDGSDAWVLQRHLAGEDR